MPVKIDYHVHTDHSYDCTTSLGTLLEKAEAEAYDIICITDHDTISAAQELEEREPQNVAVLLGCEFSADDGSHIIGLGIRDMIYYKCIFEIIAGIKFQGGLVVLPHLFRRGSGVFRCEAKRSEVFVESVLAGADMVEIFNNRDSYEHNLKSYCFVRDRNLPCVAGSDAHTLEEFGSVYVSYDSESTFIHGRSARRLFFPRQVEAHENPLKRAALEYYHRYRHRLPQTLQHVLHRARASLRRLRPAPISPPQLQYEIDNI